MVLSALKMSVFAKDTRVCTVLVTKMVSVVVAYCSVPLTFVWLQVVQCQLTSVTWTVTVLQTVALEIDANQAHSATNDNLGDLATFSIGEKQITKCLVFLIKALTRL